MFIAALSCVQRRHSSLWSLYTPEAIRSSRGILESRVSMALKVSFPRICIALGITDPTKLFEAADREAEASESFL